MVIGAGRGMGGLGGVVSGGGVWECGGQGGSVVLMHGGEENEATRALNSAGGPDRMGVLGV